MAEGDLVIGIGNTLRGDDGVGCWLAERAERLLRPPPRVLTVQQLTPELSEVLAAARRVLFIDAWLAPQIHGPGLAAASGLERHPEPLLQQLSLSPGPMDGAGPESAVLSHGFDPLQLLAITALLQGSVPDAWLLLLPAFALGHGEGFSPALSSLLPRAEALLLGWCSGDGASQLQGAARADSAGSAPGTAGRAATTH